MRHAEKSKLDKLSNCVVKFYYKEGKRTFPQMKEDTK